MRSVTFSVILFLIFGQIGFAQDLLSNNTQSNLSFNLHLPVFSDFGTSSQYFRTYYNISGWMAKLNLEYKVSDKEFLVFELPYANGKIETGVSYRDYDINTQQYSDWISEKYEINKTSIGNPFLGYKRNFKSNQSSLLIGVSIPLVDEKNSYALNTISSATVAEGLVDFYPKTVAVKVFYNFSPKLNSVFRIALGLGPELWFFTGKTSGDKTDLFAIYYFKTGIETEKAGLFAGLMNYTLITKNKLSISDATVNQLFINAKYSLGKIIPFVGYRKYLSEAPKNYKYSLQFGLSFLF